MKISVSSLSWIVLLALIVCAPAAASGATLQVPADFPTIQAAIDAAADGDTVLVAPGIYPETISFLGKAIALVSSGGAEVTTIDGGGNDVVVRFVAGEGPDSLLEGFTVTGGFNPAFDGDGGGIVCIGSSPAIEANIITANQTYWRGAGIFSDGGSPAITGNQIAGNSFVCIIADAPCGLGGGIYASGGQPVIARNIIAGNSAPDSGGAIYLAGATTALVEDNEIRANLGGTGGGVSCSGLSLVTLRNNLLVANEAVGFSTLAGPVDGFGGGLLCMGGSTVTMTNQTLTVNEASGFNGTAYGGGIALVDGDLLIENGILWQNIASVASEIAAAPTATLEVRFTDVEGGWAGVGNIDLDPLFASGPSGDHYLSQVAAGQTEESPCVDAGDPALPPIFGTTRTDEAPDTGIVDLGYHFPLPAGNPFRRGDLGADGSVNLGDAIGILSYLFIPGTPQPGCLDAADVNDDGAVQIADPVMLLSFLFLPGTPEPPPPFGSCGIDPTADSIGCAQFPGCP